MKRSVDFEMYYGASPETMEAATFLRRNTTKAEKLLWFLLQKKKVIGLHFRQQHPISIFIADFYCHSLKLVIEVDGGYHKTKEQSQYDINRTCEMNNFGIKVIRFTNEQIEQDFKSVKQSIIKECVKRKQELDV